MAQLEGYLLWNAEIERARAHARRFTDQLPWLTTAQREDVERVYLTERVAASRDALTRVRDRAAELRGEYTARYERLRARCVALAVTAVGAVTAVAISLTLLLR
nr:hypothetical protein [Streptomyces sp. 196(2019)]